MNIKNLALITFSLFSLLMHTSLSAQDLQTVSFDDYLKRFDYKERKNMKIDIPEMLDLYKQGKVQIVQQFPISRYSLFLGGMRESAFVNFLEQSHDAAGGWPRYGEPPAVG